MSVEEKYLNEAFKNPAFGSDATLYNPGYLGGPVGKELKLQMIKNIKYPQICKFCDYYLRDIKECGNSKVQDIVEKNVDPGVKLMHVRVTEIMSCKYWEKAEDLY